MKNKPLITVLSYSGGVQSSALLWMVLRGDIEVDKENFYILNADPGMENSETYKYIEMMRPIVKEKGFEIIIVDGPNLYEDIINLKNTDKTRFDNPPFWTSSGQLSQGCTQFYKIAPMDREVRWILEKNYGISRKTKNLGDNIVCKWIGFTYDEVVRVKPSPTKYAYFDYPLIDMGMKKKDVIAYLNDNDIPIPPRSVCNACFANGLMTFSEMWNNRLDDWQQAINVDESIRDLSQVGIRQKCFVSKTKIPLKYLPTSVLPGILDGDIENEYSCDSGYCFL